MRVFYIIFQNVNGVFLEKKKTCFPLFELTIKLFIERHFRQLHTISKEFFLKLILFLSETLIKMVKFFAIIFKNCSESINPLILS